MHFKLVGNMTMEELKIVSALFIQNNIDYSIEFITSTINHKFSKVEMNFDLYMVEYSNITINKTGSKTEIVITYNGVELSFKFSPVDAIEIF